MNMCDDYPAKLSAEEIMLNKVTSEKSCKLTAYNSNDLKISFCTS